MYSSRINLAGSELKNQFLRKWPDILAIIEETITKHFLSGLE